MRAWSPRCARGSPRGLRLDFHQLRTKTCTRRRCTRNRRSGTDSGRTDGAGWNDAERASFFPPGRFSAGMRTQPLANLSIPNDVSHRDPSDANPPIRATLGVRWRHAPGEIKPRSHIDSKVEQILEEMEIFPRSRLDQREAWFSPFLSRASVIMPTANAESPCPSEQT